MTIDRRLGRIPQYDPNNERYPMRKLLPRRAGLVSQYWATPESLDQGNEGSCVGHGYAHELAAEPEKVPCDHECARGIYFDAQRIDPWPGGAYAGADPFYEGTSTLAGAKVLKARGHYTGYYWAQSEEDVALTVGNVGPVVIGVDWYDGMMDVDEDGFLNVTGSVVGGHCVALIGINVDGSWNGSNDITDPMDGYYIVINSWGTGWGLNGRAKLRRTDLYKLLQADGDAVKPTRTHLPPAPEPASDDPEPDPYEPNDPPRCGFICWLKRFFDWLTGGR